jgi:hypothetical protein
VSSRKTRHLSYIFVKQVSYSETRPVSCIKTGLRLDNEASQSQLLKSYLHDKNIAFQLVPSYSHRRNATERAIRSFKDHSIAGICSTGKAFPIHLWDRLLPQAVITLNMLRISRINPKLSASTHIDGQYDYNRAPVVPLGTIIIAHETPNRRKTWAPHGQDGWYIFPALEHYRCYTVYISKTRSERVVPIENIFQQIQDARAFAVTGGQPYGYALIVNVAFTLGFNTGLFPGA